MGGIVADDSRELLANTVRAETCADQATVMFFDHGRQLAASVTWGDLTHADRVPIAVESQPTSTEVSALVSKLGRWRAKAESNG